MRSSPLLFVLVPLVLGACSATTTPSTSTPTPTPTPTPSPVAPADAGLVAPLDDCPRNNAAEEPAHVDVTKVVDHQVVRDPQARTLTETFRFEGFAVTTTRSGCAHAGMTLSVKGPGLGAATRNRVALAGLVGRLPVEDVGVFARSVGEPKACPQDRPGVEVLSCLDALITLSWTDDGAVLVYDFPL